MAASAPETIRGCDDTALSRVIAVKVRGRHLRRNRQHFGKLVPVQPNGPTLYAFGYMEEGNNLRSSAGGCIFQATGFICWTTSAQVTQPPRTLRSSQ
jgi:hypothetical protein